MERREELDLGMTKRLIGESGLQAPTKSFLLGRLTDGDPLVFLVGNFSKQDDIRAVVVSLSDESSTSALDTSSNCLEKRIKRHAFQNESLLAMCVFECARCAFIT